MSEVDREYEEPSQATNLFRKGTKMVSMRNFWMLVNLRVFLFTFTICLILLFQQEMTFASEPNPKDGVPGRSENATTAETLGNQFIRVNIAENGQFVIGTVEGDPSTGDDDNKRLLYGYPNTIGTSFTTLRIVKSNIVADYRLGIDVAPDRRPTIVQNAGSTYLSVQYTVDGVRAEQRLELVENVETGRPDLVAISYHITNISQEVRSAGVRVLLDTMIGDNDGAPFFVEGQGRLTKEFNWSRGNIPAFWIAYESPEFDENRLKAQGLLLGDGLTRPDRFATAYWPKAFDSIWDYTVDPNLSFTEGVNRPDSATLIYFDPQGLSPNQIVNYQTAYGMARLGEPNPTVELIGLEVTQAVQNWQNDVPLVANKNTAVLAHVQSSNQPISGVGARLVAIRVTDNASIGLEPVDPRNSITVQPAGVRSRTNLNDIFHFELPSDWLQGRVRMRFELTTGQPLSCAEPQTIPTNDPANDCIVEVEFETVEPTMRIEFVGVPYQQQFGGTIITRTVTRNDAERVAQTLLELYPVPADQLEWDYRDLPGIFASPPDFSTKEGGLEAFTTVNIALDALRSEDECGEGCRTLYYGILRQPQGFAGGVLGAASGVPSEPDDPIVWTGSGLISDAISYTSNLLQGALTTTPAHEIGHILGLPHTMAGRWRFSFSQGWHTDDCDFSQNRWFNPLFGPFGVPEKWQYPYPDDRIDFLSPVVGFDQYGFGTISRAIRQPDMGGDLMSYCNPSWVSDWTYAHLRTAILARLGGESIVARSASAEQYVIVRGWINTTTNSNAFLEPLYTLETTASFDVPTEGDYTLRFLDASGSTIASYNFTPRTPVEPNEEGELIASFSLTLPYVPSAQRIELVHGGTILVERVASDVPIVQVLAPNGGEILDQPTVTIEWNANDPDNDALTFSVQYSADNGQNWRAIATDMVSTTLTISRTNFAGTTEGLIRVTASDGFTSIKDQSDQVFTVASNTPDVWISRPSNDQIFAGNQMVVLSGSGLDTEDGPLNDGALTWASNLDGALGTGERLDLFAGDMSEGTHEITLTATDSSGQTRSRTISIQVVRGRPTLPARLSATPEMIRLYAVVNGPIGDGETIAIRNSGDGVLTWNLAGDQDWLRFTSDNGESPSNIIVAADPTGLPVGVYTGTLTVTSSAIDSPQTIQILLTVEEGLAAGWNLISLGHQPLDRNTASVLRTILPSLLVALGFEEQAQSFYVDTPEFNTLLNMDSLHAYWLNLAEAERLVIDGPTMTSIGTPIELEVGWNAVAYLPNRSLPVESALASISGKYDKVLGYEQGALSFYIQIPPALNTLTTMEPNAGYWIHMNQPGTLDYSQASMLSMRSIHASNQPQSTDGIAATNEWINVYSTASTYNGQPLPFGSTVSALGEDGRLLGQVYVRQDGAYGLLAVYGDDGYTAEVDGARIGETIRFLINGQPATITNGVQPVWSSNGALMQVDLSAAGPVFEQNRLFLPDVAR